MRRVGGEDGRWAVSVRLELKMLIAVVSEEQPCFWEPEAPES